MDQQPLDTRETERLLGRLEGATTEIQRTVGRVLDNQESSRAEFTRHIDQDAENFDRVRKDLGEGLVELRERVLCVEGIADTVESHGDALLTLENRLLQQSTEAKVLASVRANNARWLGIAAAAAGGMAGASSLWHKVWTGLVSIMK